MIESVLARHNVKPGVKIAVKTFISAGVVALAVILPQIVHLFAGAQGGVQWLPMYLPVLLGGFILGSVWGLGIGVLSPLVSFAITSAWGDPMPALARLPFMMAELAVFAADHTGVGMLSAAGRIKWRLLHKDRAHLSVGKRFGDLRVRSHDGNLGIVLIMVISHKFRGDGRVDGLVYGHVGAHVVGRLSCFSRFLFLLLHAGGKTVLVHRKPFFL